MKQKNDQAGLAIDLGVTEHLSDLWESPDFQTNQPWYNRWRLAKVLHGLGKPANLPPPAPSDVHNWIVDQVWFCARGLMLYYATDLGFDVSDLPPIQDVRSFVERFADHVEDSCSHDRLCELMSEGWRWAGGYDAQPEVTRMFAAAAEQACHEVYILRRLLGTRKDATAAKLPLCESCEAREKSELPE